jgi:hypothetical protein
MIASIFFIVARTSQDAKGRQPRASVRDLAKLPPSQSMPYANPQAASFAFSFNMLFGVGRDRLGAGIDGCSRLGLYA